MSRGTARPPLLRGEIVALCRATTSCKGRGCRAAPRDNCFLRRCVLHGATARLLRGDTGSARFFAGWRCAALIQTLSRPSPAGTPAAQTIRPRARKALSCRGDTECSRKLCVAVVQSARPSPAGTPGAQTTRPRARKTSPKARKTSPKGRGCRAVQVARQPRATTSRQPPLKAASTGLPRVKHCAVQGLMRVCAHPYTPWCPDKRGPLAR